VYIRINQIRFDVSRVQQARRLTEEQVVPAVRQLPGFRRYVLSGELTAGRGALLSEWDTRDQAQALPAAMAYLAEEVARLGIEIEPGTVYEVFVEAQRPVPGLVA
jgi:hypothetical protein